LDCTVRLLLRTLRQKESCEVAESAMFRTPNSGLENIKTNNLKLAEISFVCDFHGVILRFRNIFGTLVLIQTFFASKYFVRNIIPVVSGEPQCSLDGRLSGGPARGPSRRWRRRAGRTTCGASGSSCARWPPSDSLSAPGGHSPPPLPPSIPKPC